MYIQKIIEKVKMGYREEIEEVKMGKCIEEIEEVKMG